MCEIEVNIMFSSSAGDAPDDSDDVVTISDGEQAPDNILAAMANIGCADQKRRSKRYSYSDR